MSSVPQFDPERSDAIRALLVDVVNATPVSRRWRRRRWLVAGSIVVGSLTLAGSAAAWAVGQVNWIATPATSPGGSATFAPVPNWPVNASGQTYGVQGDSPIAPDLVKVTATNGKTGYVTSKDLDDADGTTASRNFHNPQDAVDWSKNHQGKVTYIPVYASDGTTKVGVFEVG